jgi:type III restriction enzyme
MEMPFSTALPSTHGPLIMAFLDPMIATGNDPSVRRPTQKIIENRRRAEFITPIPKPKKRKISAKQEEIVFDEGKGLSTKEQQYDPTSIINELRAAVDQWRALPNSNQWQVTPETARLLQHWRHHNFTGVRPFFCQVEAVETAIWLTEVAPQSKSGKRFSTTCRREQGRQSRTHARCPEARHRRGQDHRHGDADRLADHQRGAPPGSKNFTRGFLSCARPDDQRPSPRSPAQRPRQLLCQRELVPGDMLDDVNRAKIVITNFHAFKLRERIEFPPAVVLCCKGAATN